MNKNQKTLFEKLIYKNDLATKKKIAENLEYQERVFWKLEEFFHLDEKFRNLVSVDHKLNYTIYTYEINEFKGETSAITDIYSATLLKKINKLQGFEPIYCNGMLLKKENDDGAKFVFCALNPNRFFIDYQDINQSDIESKKRVSKCWVDSDSNPIAFAPEELRAISISGEDETAVLNSLKCAVAEEIELDGFNKNLNLIIVDKSGEFNALNGVKCNLAGKIIDDYSLLFALNDWLNEEIERRKNLFNELSVSDFESYNKKCKKQLPEILVVFNNFMDIRNYFSCYSVEYTVKLAFIVSRAIKMGIRMIFASPCKTTHPFTNNILLRCSTKFSYKVITGWASAGTCIEGLADGLFKEIDAVKYSVNGIKRLIPCHISDDCFNEICKRNSKPTNLEENALYSFLVSNSKKGKFSKQARENDFYQRAMMETMRLAITRGKIADLPLMINLLITMSEAKETIRRLVEKDYLTAVSAVYYESKINAIDFKNIFGEPV